MANTKKIKVTLIRSVNGSNANHRLCVKGLGLGKTNHSVILADDPCVRGLIKKVSYLLSVEEV